MSSDERNTYVSLISSLLINAYMIWRLVEMFGAGTLSGPDALQIWARMVLWVIGAAIVLTIVLTILFNIVFAIATGEKSPQFLSDERDRVFEVRGMGATTLVMIFGFIGAIVALALGQTPLFAFIQLYFSLALGSLAGDLVKLASYRHGG